jgi:alpha-L-fucosidase 2
MKSLLTLLLCTAAIASTLDAAETKLWYEQPAQVWERDALPIGNGRLGAMLFGGTSKDRIQFNEDTLWIGDEQDTGAYQNFGELLVDFQGAAIQSTSSPGEQTSPADQDVEASTDGNSGTKWCLEHGGQPVVWLGKLGRSPAISKYSFTSGNDMPDRDPRSWTLEGSNDGVTWKLLDRREKRLPSALAVNARSSHSPMPRRSPNTASPFSTTDRRRISKLRKSNSDNPDRAPNPKTTAGNSTSLVPFTLSPSSPTE